MFIINCKNYDEIAGAKITKLVDIAGNVAEKYGIKIALANDAVFRYFGLIPLQIRPSCCGPEDIRAYPAKK